MNAEILAVGTEILMGQITNTNAQYISKRLQDIGVNVFYHSVVGDNSRRLKECVNIALQRADVLIITGGLGPTQDDLTKETVSEVLGMKLILHEPSLDKIIARFEKLGRRMVDSNKKQAYLPEGCTIINNNNGTAPGCIIEYKSKKIIMLPGPPSEMKAMLEDSIIPFLEEKSDYKIVSKYLNIVGIGESLVEEMLIDLIDKQDNPTIATYAKEGQVTLRLTARCKNNEKFEDLCALVENEIYKRLGEAIYSSNDCSIEETVAQFNSGRSI